MKILVTGGAGFIGSRIVRQYIEAGHTVSVIDDLSTGRLDNIHPSARFYRADITGNLHDIFLREAPEVVNHLAAQVSVNNSIDDAIVDATINILGSINLLETSVNNNVRKFIYSSSAAVYGEPVYLPIDEKHPIEPISPYGISKHTVEHYLHYYYKTYGIDYIILRYSNVYGCGDKNDVISIFINKMLKNERITIYGDGNQTRDFISVGDVARANVLALANRNRANTYNIGSGHGISINDLFVEIRQFCDYVDQPIYVPEKSGEIKKMVFDTSKANSLLGWSPFLGLKDGLRQLVREASKHL